MRWSKPFHGVQHFIHAPPPWQATVTDRGTFAEAMLLCLIQPHPFTPTAEKTFRGVHRVVKCQAWLERQLRLRVGLKGPHFE